MTMIGKRRKNAKKGSKVKIIVATKRIYTRPVRTLRKRFNEDQEHTVSITVFFTCKTFYLLKPSEKYK